MPSPRSRCAEPQATTQAARGAARSCALVDTNGRAIERSLTRSGAGRRPIASACKSALRAGGGSAEGSEAAFDVIAVRPTARPSTRPASSWTLSRVETNYQWYRDNGTWKWEAITTTRASGQRHRSTRSRPARLPFGASVDWGRYRLEGRKHAARAPPRPSYEFYAGYYYPEAGLGHARHAVGARSTRPAYQVGETAKPEARSAVRRHRAGDGGRRPHHRHEGGRRAREGGTTVDLPVTDDWGPGRLCDGHRSIGRPMPPKSGCRRVRSASPMPTSIRAT